MSLPLGYHSLTNLHQLHSFQAPIKNGLPVHSLRSNPDAALALTAEDIDQAFFSLGFGGYVIVGFDFPLKTGEGDDVRVYEKTYNPDYAYHEERADVYAWHVLHSTWHLLSQ
ncbi:hypothetical protein BVY03_00575, partial [bacterium K02(2017)]